MILLTVLLTLAVLAIALPRVATHAESFQYVRPFRPRATVVRIAVANVTPDQLVRYAVQWLDGGTVIRSAGFWRDDSGRILIESGAMLEATVTADSIAPAELAARLAAAADETCVYMSINGRHAFIVSAAGDISPL